MIAETSLRMRRGPLVAHSSRRPAFRRPFLLRRETLERRLHEPGQRARVVAALEDSGDPGRERRATSRKLAEAEVRELDVCQRVLDVRVETGGDDEHVGLEATYLPLDLGKCVEVLAVAGARRHRDVQRR